VALLLLLPLLLNTTADLDAAATPCARAQVLLVVSR
jgi:hypothetical protein